MHMYLSSFMFFAPYCYYSYAKILIIGNYQNRLNVSIPFHGKYIYPKQEWDNESKKILNKKN